MLFAGGWKEIERNIIMFVMSFELMCEGKRPMRKTRTLSNQELKNENEAQNKICG